LRPMPVANARRVNSTSSTFMSPFLFSPFDLCFDFGGSRSS
jgi:hypothetical protein